MLTKTLQSSRQMLPWSGVVLGLYLCVIGGMLDVFLSFLLLPMGLASLWSLLPVMAAEIAILMGVTGLLILAGRMVGIPRRDVSGLMGGAFSGSLASGLAIVSTAHRMLLPRLDPFPGAAIVVGVLISIGVAIVASLVARRLAEQTITMVSNLVVILMTTFFVVWVLAYHAESAISVIGVSAIAFQVLVFGFVVYIQRRARWNEALAKWIGRAIPVFVPLALVFVVRHPVQSGIRQADERYENEGRAIKKVILICIDTLRADHLSCMGGSEAQTPRMDKLAADGVMFERAISSAPWTRPSVASMMTGVPSDAHTVINAQRRLPEGIGTLAEGFEGKGYFTALIGDNLNLMPAAGLDRGFIEYNYFPRFRNELGWSTGAHVLRRMFLERLLADATTADLNCLTERWLQANREKDFFLWLHLFTPHLPYSPPRELIPNEGYESSVGFMFDPYLEDNRKYPPRAVPPEAAQTWIRKLYASEVRQADQAVGHLVDVLHELEMYDETLIILTSDHGEELWRHGKLGHGHALFDELLHVPMIFKLPGSERAGKVVPQTVPTLGIFQTLNQLCELGLSTPYPLAASYAPLWGDSIGAHFSLPVISQGVMRPPEPDQRAVTLDGMKYVSESRVAEAVVYDLKSDFDEMRPTPAKESAELDEIKKALRVHDESCAAIRKVVGEATEFTLPTENIKGLEALGYLE